MASVGEAELTGLVELRVKFGKLIRNRRLAAGLTQEELATRSKLHPTYISMLERGLRLASLLVVRQLAKALKTTMTSLVEELENS